MEEKCPECGMSVRMMAECFCGWDHQGFHIEKGLEEIHY